MKTKQPSRRKHTPQRTCVGCRKVLAKRNLIRIVRTADGVFVDPTGRLAGRGAYLHSLKSCWERALKGGLQSSLKIKLSADDHVRLKAALDEQPES